MERSAVLRNVSTRLQMARWKHGQSLEHLSQAVNIPKSRLQGFEAARLEPFVDEVDRLAVFYHVTLDWLVGRDRLSTEAGAEG